LIHTEIPTKFRKNIDNINVLATKAKDDIEAREVLWNKLKNLVYSEAKRCCLSFYRLLREDWNEFFEDLVSELYIIYDKCLKNWDCDRKDFLGYAKFNFHFLLMVTIRDKYIKDWRVIVKKIEQDYIKSQTGNDDVFEILAVMELINEIEQDRVSSYYFLEGKTQQEIADITRVSQSKVSNQINQLKDFYKEKFSYFCENN
jgi:RNA polymerase sigma factor (sigma-70 family)